MMLLLIGLDNKYLAENLAKERVSFPRTTKFRDIAKSPPSNFRESVSMNCQSLGLASIVTTLTVHKSK